MGLKSFCGMLLDKEIDGLKSSFRPVVFLLQIGVIIRKGGRILDPSAKMASNSVTIDV